MDNSSSGEEPECQGYFPAFDVQGLTSSIVGLHILTIFAYIFTARKIYKHVDIGHPVFALIFQEVIVLPLLEFVGVLMLVASTWLKSESVMVLYFLIGRVSWLFHPVTWLIVTYLRYYILLAKKCENLEENIDKYKRKALCLVWALFVPFLVLSVSVAQLILRLHGWPQIKTKLLPESVVTIGSLSGTAIANIPDFISICIYYRMWKNFKTNVVGVSDTVTQDESDTYGGIWVGDANETMSVCVEDNLETCPDNTLNYQRNDKADNSHETKAVMHALRYHIGLALMDIALTVRTYFYCSLIKVVLVYILQVIFIYWIPLLVIVNGFKQIRVLGILLYISPSVNL